MSIEITDVAHFVGLAPSHRDIPLPKCLEGRHVPAKHPEEFGESHIGLTVGVRTLDDSGDENLVTAWLTLDKLGSPIVVLTNESGLVVSDSVERTRDEYVDVQAVTKFVIAHWDGLVANQLRDARVRAEHWQQARRSFDLAMKSIGRMTAGGDGS